ncbi:FAD-binding domain-containing protein [Auricularia subglabra TFB-10046 SS5]|nr:FAD-binding domain-containing protein [Auricularia subglabra TFB-10046 SS5]
MATELLSTFPNDRVLTPKDGAAYESALGRWSGTSVRRAQYILFPTTAEEVSKAVCFAVRSGLELAVKGGGHSCSGASASEGVIIDLARLNEVKIDAPARIARVGGGALWKDVDSASAASGLATVGGTVNDTGVGGLTVGGGFGFLCPKYGLVIDNLLEAQVVLANGDVVTCNGGKHADLFWGIRGGGSNFGIVAQFTFRLYPQLSTVWSGLLIFTPDKLSELFRGLETWYNSAGEDEGVNVFFGCTPPAFMPALVVLPFFNGPAEEGRAKFKAVLDVGPVADMTSEMPYPAANTIQQAPMTTHGDRKLFKATSFAAFDAATFQHLFDEYSGLVEKYPDTRGSAVIMELYPADKIVSVPSTATAFPSRMRRCNINFVPRWKDVALDKVMYDWATAQVDYMRKAENVPTRHAVRRYPNYGFGDERARDVFGENYERMARVKAVYDPTSVFHKWYPVTPTS